ncbi:hypothetical protein HK099_005240 [Clydaea vesicula]|uniref:ENTH domain-containing protein n=1 Tax=Clydaea vesicula TaxID=447962 RepID=A0AAD5UC49_9FUNG|nr:hypothetical protein HK099_005240 [Clydaea vesicula]
MSGIKEKVRIAKHYFNDIERYILKSTTGKIKPLKPKHVQALTSITWQNDVSIDVVFELIGKRFREGHWVCVFKSLILIHILIRDGHTDKILSFLSANPQFLKLNGYRDTSSNFVGNIQAKNIRAYASYLEEKVKGYNLIRDDFVRRQPEYIAKFRSMPYENGLLEQVKSLQSQISALLNCSFYLDEIDNLVTLQSFRLLIGDAMALFHLLNEGVIKILSCYFEMERDYASKALEIYKVFSKQTTKTVEMFEIARKLRSSLGVEVPVFKHAPVSLGSALEEYLNSPDFEAQRLAYKLKKQQKEKPAVKETKTSLTAAPSKIEKTPSKIETSPPKKDIDQIDFFSSLDEHFNSYNSPTNQANFNNFANNQVSPFISGNPFVQNSPQQQYMMQQQLPLVNQQNQANPFQHNQNNFPQQNNNFTVENVFGANNVLSPFSKSIVSNNTGSTTSNFSGNQSVRQTIAVSDLTGNTTLDPFALNSNSNFLLQQQHMNMQQSSPLLQKNNTINAGFNTINDNTRNFSHQRSHTVSSSVQQNGSLDQHYRNSSQPNANLSPQQYNVAPIPQFPMSPSNRFSQPVVHNSPFQQPAVFQPNNNFMTSNHQNVQQSKMNSNDGLGIRSSPLDAFNSLNPFGSTTVPVTSGMSLNAIANYNQYSHQSQPQQYSTFNKTDFNNNDLTMGGLGQGNNNPFLLNQNTGSSSSVPFLSSQVTGSSSSNNPFSTGMRNTIPQQQQQTQQFLGNNALGQVTNG